MKKFTKLSTISLLMCATLIGPSGCTDEIEPFILEFESLSHDDEAVSIDSEPLDSEPFVESSIDPFFERYLGTWRSPCLFDPDRLTGPATGDNVVYELSFAATQTTWAHQDYMDEDCIEQWPHGAGSVTSEFRLSTRLLSESGLVVAMFVRDAGTTIVEAISVDPTPNNETAGSATSVNALSSYVPVLDIVHLSSSGDLFLGDQSSAPDNDTAPTRLDLNTAWMFSNDTQAPQIQPTLGM